MTTSDGVPRPATVRRHIQTLRDRRDFVAGRIAATPTRPGAGYDAAEVAALDWAIPVLEDEFDNTARLHREGIAR